MKSRIVLRAEFQQPTEVKMHLPVAIAVEVYHAKVGPPAEWRARRPGTKTDFPKITAQSTPQTLMRQIADIHFEKQLSAWKAFDILMEPPRLLTSDEWTFDKATGNAMPTPHYFDVLKEEGRKRSVELISERKAKALEGM